MLSEGHHKRGISLSRIAELLATNPARIMGFGDRKGAIAVGLDADLALIDLNGTTEVSSAKSLSSAGYSIYDGWKLKGRVVHTLVRGAFAMRDGALDDACVGRGRYIRRRLSADLAFSRMRARRRDDPCVGVARADKLQADRQALFARSSPAATGTARAAASTCR